MINVMFIDLKVFTDARVKKLMERYQWSKRETLGTLLEVWSLVYVRNSAVIAEEDVDELAATPGFASSLVSVAQLARRVEAGIALKGASAALALRDELHAKNERKKHPENDESSNARARTRVHARTHSRASSSEGVLDVSAGSESSEDLQRKIRKADRAELRRITDAFTFQFKKHHSRTPTWKKHDLSNLLRLVKQVGAVEVLERMRFMFESPPRWMDPPFTLSTLVQHFDHFVPTTKSAAKSKHGRFERGADTDYSKPPWEVRRDDE